MIQRHGPIENCRLRVTRKAFNRDGGLAASRALDRHCASTGTTAILAAVIAAAAQDTSAHGGPGEVLWNGIGGGDFRLAVAV